MTSAEPSVFQSGNSEERAANDATDKEKIFGDRGDTFFLIIKVQ
jgi:hypothetical protein